MVGPRSGVGNATASLLDAMAKCWPEDWPPASVFVNSPRHPLPGGDAWPKAPCYAVRRTRLSGRVLLRGWQYLNWPPAQWLAGSFDVLHSPAAYIAPARGARRILTIHDLYCMIRSDHVQPYGGAYFAATYPKKLKAIDHVIAISEFTRREIERLFDFDPARVTVIPHGVDLARYCPEPEAGDALARRSLGLDGPYLLFVGTIEPRKNLPGLLDAYGRLAAGYEREGRTAPRLAIAGMPGWGMEEFGAALGRLGPAAAGVSMLGYVETEMLPALYRGAAGFCFPSFYEGFGLPLLEALACGCPVLSSNSAAMPEAGGEAARYATPGDAEAWAEGMKKMLMDAGENDRRRELGGGHASRFTWRVTAQATLDLYRKIGSPGVGASQI